MKKVAIIFTVIFLASFSLADDLLKDADLAWTWYSSDRTELANTLRGYLDSAAPEKIEGPVFAIISPHAAYQFSGSIAAYGFKAVEGRDVKTVIVLGFSHRRFFDGVSVYDRGAWRTPLGDMPVNEKLAKEIISKNKRFKFEPSLFRGENSIEMQIPLIQMAFKDASIVPIALGTQDYEDAEDLSDALSAVLQDRSDVLMVVSTDMSHYHGYRKAVEIDKRTMDLVSRLDEKALYDEACKGEDGKSELCGLLPVTTSIMTAKKLGYDKVKILKYANSGDTTDDKLRVVGYFSAVIYKEAQGSPARMGPEPGRAKLKAQSEGKAQGSPNPNEVDGSGQAKVERGREMLTAAQKRKLLQIARESMASFVVFNKRKSFKEDDPVLNEPRGAFVTLHKDGELRGCIGNIVSKAPLYKTVSDMAVEAATRDPRFRPVKPDEINSVDLEISVLTPLKKVKDRGEISIPGHGVLVRRGAAGGVFLPQVALETGWGKEEFLSNLCSHKAGLSPEAWRDPDTELYVFSAEVFGEKDIKR